MYSEYKIKCLDCDDTITAIYDSRKRKENWCNWIKCSCGKLNVKPDEYSYSYYPKGNPKKISNSHRFLKEDYLVLNKELQEKYNTVKGLAESVGFTEFIDEDEVEGEGFVNSICLEKSETVKIESVTMSFKLSFQKLTGWSDEEIIESDKKIAFRLNEFEKFLLKANVEREILSDIKYLWDTNDFNVEGDRKQLELYDYEFYF